MIVVRAGTGIVERQRLIALIAARPEPIILVEALAGMGKSTLLAQLGRALALPVRHGGDIPPASGDDPILWDIPPGAQVAPLPDVFVRGARRLVIAKRPETDIPGLARARTYGHVFVLDLSDLLLTDEDLRASFPDRQADRLMAQSGGWPMLLNAPSARAGRHLADFIASELLQPMAADGLVAIRSWLDGAPDHGLEPAMPILLERLGPALPLALDTLLEDRARNPATAPQLARAYQRRGRITEAILTFQRAGCHAEAFGLFETGGGRFYLYRHGPTAFDRTLAGFPPDYASGNDTLVMCLAMQSLKRGEIEHARRLLANRFGAAANNLDTVFADRGAYSLDFLAFRIVMLIYEDYLLTDRLFEQVFDLLGDLAIDDHLPRGSFYNAVVEFYIRARRFAAAEDVAARALHHYERADVPLLAFYISLHQAIMRLMMGDAISARRHASQAETFLRRVGFDSAGDERLLALLFACVDYEGGKAEPLARFLNSQFDDFAHGEIWPSLIEFALQYGSQALSEHFSIIAARNFLDRWRVYQISNRQFGMMIELREATILQNGNRWQEAAEKLAPVRSRITRQWVTLATDELERLRDRDEIILALIWLRHLVYEMPNRPGLLRQLEAMLNNLNLTGRQRIGVEVWLAFACKRQRDLSRARALLQKVFEHVARLGAVAPLAEESIFLSELIEHQRIGQFLDASGPVRHVLRRLRDNGLPNSALGARSGLSRRETKVLTMISEGASNKFIANALGLSEATVKFHLGNVYRKLGCQRRREAISAARALGLVS